MIKKKTRLRRQYYHLVTYIYSSFCQSHTSVLVTFILGSKGQRKSGDPSLAKSTVITNRVKKLTSKKF